MLGIGTLLLFIVVPGWGEVFPQQLAGILAAFGGMMIGSLVPKKFANHTGNVHHFVGSAERV